MGLDKLRIILQQCLAAHDSGMTPDPMLLQYAMLQEISQHVVHHAVATHLQLV